MPSMIYPFVNDTYICMLTVNEKEMQTFATERP